MLSERRYSSSKLRKFRDVCMEGCNFVPPITGGPDVVCVNILIFTWTKWVELSQLPWTKIVQKSKYNKTKLQYRPWALQHLHVRKLCAIWRISTKNPRKKLACKFLHKLLHRLFTRKLSVFLRWLIWFCLPRLLFRNKFKINVLACVAGAQTSVHWFFFQTCL